MRHNVHNRARAQRPQQSDSERKRTRKKYVCCSSLVLCVECLTMKRAAFQISVAESHLGMIHKNVKHPKARKLRKPCAVYSKHRFRFSKDSEQTDQKKNTSQTSESREFGFTNLWVWTSMQPMHVLAEIRMRVHII